MSTCSNCEVTVYNLSKGGTDKVQQYAIETVPAVVVDGRLAACCDTRGPDEEQLRAAGLGQAIT